MLEKTLVILKPCTIQRALIGEVINRFERKMQEKTNEPITK